MAKGMYSSGMSAWERRKAGLAADHCGPETIDEVKPVEAPEVEEVVEAVEEVKVEKKEKKAEKKAGKKSFFGKGKTGL
jgi:hypothetical protein